ncbi:FHA domain-containing protein [Streptomyces avermitilis]|uniref:FHA domain-containing protein n=1 Tax=Streptomyces avermitilis TaxID=33903 RepID=UPI002117B7B0|nr:FHA domain-containing protein [Streptomyces avermitilis]
MGRTGPFAGQSVVLGSAPLRFGRKSDNDVIIVSVSASRLHTEIVAEDGAFVLYDRSKNGTFVNDQRVTRHVLVPGDSIRIGDETFLFETQEALETVIDLSQLDLPRANASANPGELRVTVTGGGPVGLAFALLLENALPGRRPSPSTTAGGSETAPPWSGRTRPRATSAASRSSPSRAVSTSHSPRRCSRRCSTRADSPRCGPWDRTPWTAARPQHPDRLHRGQAAGTGQRQVRDPPGAEAIRSVGAAAPALPGTRPGDQ